MKTERIYLDPSDERVYLDTYLPNLVMKDAPAILVIPGGGYSMVCTDREGEPIAMGFAAFGYVPFVLNYRCGREEDVYPKQLVDASRAILWIRAHAKEYGIDPHKVYATGFSAGGHLAGTLACSFDDVTEELGIQKGENRPDAVALAYPVVTLNANTHQGSFVHLLNRPDMKYTQEERELLSLDSRVTEETCPMFLWHTAEDQAVPPVGTLMLAAALIEKKIPVTLRLYPYGPHGVALGNQITETGNPAFVQPIAEEWIAETVRFFATL